MSTVFSVTLLLVAVAETFAQSSYSRTFNQDRLQTSGVLKRQPSIVTYDREQQQYPLRSRGVSTSQFNSESMLPVLHPASRSMGPLKQLNRSNKRVTHIPSRVASRAQRIADDGHSESVGKRNDNNSNNEDIKVQLTDFSDSSLARTDTTTQNTTREFITINKGQPTVPTGSSSYNKNASSVRERDSVHQPPTRAFLERRDLQESHKTDTVVYSPPTRGAESKAGSEEIIFPDTKFKPRTACENGGYCENVDSYPKEYLNNFFKNDVGLYGSYFGNDTISELANRITPELERELCGANEKLIFPKVAQNKDNEWMFIVNLDESYTQGVRVEICQKDNSPCTFSINFPAGYKSSCKQKYIYRKLLAVNSEGNPAPGSFRLPSCCACFYTKTK